MHLALEIDDSKGAVQNESEALDRAIRVVRNRIDELGVAEPVVQKSGTDRIIVELPGVDDPERAQRVIERAAFLEFQITDETQALERSLPRLDAIAAAHLAKAAPGRPAAPAAGAAPAAAPALTELLRGAADSGARADTARRDTTKGDTAGRDTARAAGRDNATRGVFSQAVSPGQLPGQYIVSDADYARLRTVTDLPEARAALPPGKVMRWGADSIVDAASGRVFRALYVLDARPIITGESLVDARPQSDPVEGTKVDFQLSREGGRRFETETARHIKDIMAVVLDQRVITAPQIQSAIRTNGQITLGGGALQEAQDLAIVLRAGALPAPLRVAETRAIGASLGADAVEQGIRAGLLGLGLVVAIMIGYYRFSGVLAVAGLLFYALTTLAFLAGFDATLTLPGIAGFILSIGMAVDANFLQFERIREELDKGRSVRSAVEEGFRHSFAAIVDSHMTTALTALVLYQFGTGPVRGFAVTLLAGVASSMVSAVFVVRTLFLAWLKQRPSETRTLSI
jgi:preprotein translocase subunit SecD